MAALCRRLSSVAPKVIRSLSRTVSTISEANPVVKTFPRCSNEIHRRFSSAKPLPQKEKVTIHFVLNDGERQTVQAKLGDNLLDVVIENDVDVDGFGACEGTLACSTCHLIFKETDYNQLPEKPSDEELDMLDLAYGLEDTSRLGCQIIVTKNMDGWEIRVPEGVSDAREPSRLGCQIIVTKNMDGWEIRVPEGVSDAREP